MDRSRHTAAMARSRQANLHQERADLFRNRSLRDRLGRGPRRHHRDDRGSSRQPLQTVLVRLRHPRQMPIRSVTVNGQAWKRFNPDKEVIELAGLTGKRSDYRQLLKIKNQGERLG